MQKVIQIEESSAERLLPIAARAGFEGVSISFKHSEALLCAKDGSLERRLDTLGTLLLVNALICTHTHLPVYPASVPFGAPDKRTEAAIEAGLRATSLLGARWAVMHPHFRSEKGMRAPGAWRRYMARYLKLAQSHGIGIALENRPGFPNDPFRDIYGARYEELSAIADEFDDEHLGICWAPAHALLAQLDQKKALKAIGSRLKLIHLHDNHGTEDEHLLPFEGAVDWGELTASLQNAGYAGALTVAARRSDEEAEDTFVQKSFAAVKRLEELLQA